jgi:ABC-type Zn uptake system ZnuABC Zn-binding protein ZnuA
MKKFLLILMCLIITTGSLVGCGNDTDEFNEKNKIKIVTTNYVLADFSRQIGGKNVSVEVLLNSNENSLTHVATNKDKAKINEADIFIHNGSDAEPWVYEITDNLENKNILIINASNGISTKNSNYNINKADDKDYQLKFENIKEETSKENTNEQTEESESTENTNESIEESVSKEDNDTSIKENINKPNYSYFEYPQITIKDIRLTINEFDLNKINSNIILEGTTSDGYNIRNLPINYKLNDDACFEQIKKVLEGLEDKQQFGISNESNILIFEKDSINGDKFVGTQETLDDLDNLNCIYDNKSKDYIYNLVKSYTYFNGLTKDAELDIKIINQKALSLTLNKLYKENIRYYCLYNTTIEKPELFFIDNSNSNLKIYYITSINSNTDLLHYTMAQEEVICDSKSFYFFDKQKNATTEVKQYYNYWMDLNNAKIMIENIYNGIITKNEKNKDYYLENFNNYMEMVESLNLRYQKIAENSKNKFVILTGEFNCYYLLRYLDLDYMSVYDYEYQDTNPTIIRQSNIIQFINNNKNNIKYVLTEGDSSITESICNETGVVSLEINSLTNIERKNQLKDEFSYINIMENNYLILKTTLN